MKKRILIFSAIFAAFCITSFGFITWEDADTKIAENTRSTPIYSDLVLPDTRTDFEFVYKLESRFMRTVTKEKIDQALSVIDILPAEGSESISSYQNILVSTFAEDRKDWIKARGENEVFNETQIQILRSMDYGSSFSITGNIRKEVGAGGRLVDDTLIYYMTVVPNKPSVYKKGKDALITYIKDNSKEAIAIARNDQIKPGKIGFIITKDGAIDHVKLTSTSGYTSIDERMLELFREIPGSWEAATNAKGEKVDQGLVFFFGLIGC